MSGLKKGTIIVECNPNLKNRFIKILPFTDGLNIHFEEEDDCLQIQYELEKQDLDNLLASLNSQDKKEYRLISHSEEQPQPSSREYDVARDVSKILCYDEDQEDDLDQGKIDMMNNGGHGSIGKPLDDMKNVNSSNSKNLKSKSSPFYSPNDPRSFNQEDQGVRAGPIGGGIGAGAGAQIPNKGMYYASSMPYRVDHFDQVFGDDDPGFPEQPPVRQMGMQNQGMMMNPNLQRGGNPNMNPNMNPNAKNMGGMAMGQQNMGGMMGHPGMGPGPVGTSQMYPPMANRPGANPNQYKPGPLPNQGGMGMNPNYPQKHPQATTTGRGAMQGNPDTYYGGAGAGAGIGGYEEPQPMPHSAKGRMGAKANQPPVYNDYGGYQEDEQVHGYNPNEFAGGRNAGPINPQMRGGAARGGFQQQGRNPGQQPYGQYPRDDYQQDPRMGGYQDMGGNTRNPAPAGGHMRPGVANPGMRGGMGGNMQMQQQQRYQEDQYYEEEYPEEEDPYSQGGAMGGSYGHGKQESHLGYDNYGGMNQQPMAQPAGQYGGVGARAAPNQMKNDYMGNAPIPQPNPAFGGASQQSSALGATVQEPFTVEGSINSQYFDTKPGFDRLRKKVHHREKLRASLQKSKPAEPKNGKSKNNKNPGLNSQGQSETDRKNSPEKGGVTQPEGNKEPRNADMDVSEGEEADNNSRGFLEEEISSASDQKNNSQGSQEDQQGSNDPDNKQS